MPFLGTGTINVFSIDEIENETTYSFLENVFLQAMHEVEQGKNMFIGNDLFIKKNTAYEHMMKIVYKAIK